VTTTLSSDSIAAYTELSRDLEGWIIKARTAGLDDESMGAIFQRTIRTAIQEEVT
jgi:GntR family transcriptional regulator